MDTNTNTQTEEKKDFHSEMICEVPRSKTEVVRISRGNYKGTSFIDVRVFFKDEKDGAFKPTRKGLTLRSEIRGVIEGLTKAEETAPVQSE